MYLIIGCGTLKREQTFERIRKLADRGVQILAPVDEVMVKRRPRRRRKGEAPAKPKVKKVAIFFDYVAVEFEPIQWTWQKLLRTPGVWFVLMHDEKPLLVQRKALGGLAAGDGFENWEGETVMFVGGPMAGQMGKFVDGEVQVEMMGRTVKARAAISELTKI